MNEYGFVKVGAFSCGAHTADVQKNTEELIEAIATAKEELCDLIVFPEMVLTSYTVNDMLNQDILQREVQNSLIKIAKASTDTDMLIFVGLPFIKENALYNCAAAINNGEILGIIPKTYLPNYREFYDKRWFSSWGENENSYVKIMGRQVPFGTKLLFYSNLCEDFSVGAEICEDLWVPSSPGTFAALNGAKIIVNLSASNETIQKDDYRRDLVKITSAKNICAYVYTSSGEGESTTDLIFAGHRIIAQNGKILKEFPPFEKEDKILVSHVDVRALSHERRIITSFEDTRQLNKRSYEKIPFISKMQVNTDKLIFPVSSHPFVPKNEEETNDVTEKILTMQSHALKRRIESIHAKSLIIGVSGGLDSTLALLVLRETCHLLGKKNDFITAVTMPGFATSDRTYKNAIDLINLIGAKLKQIPIANALDVHFKDIRLDKNTASIAYENAQARERTQILMDLANMEGGIVVGTGDLSEIALGWSTYNGDHMSMYNVNAGIPKTLIRYLIRHIARRDGGKLKEILQDIIATPISPELIPKEITGKMQDTEDSVGKYELNDFFLYYVLRHGFEPKKVFYLANIAFDGIYDRTYIKKILILFYKRFFSSQFKRSAMPDGVKVGSVSLSVRGDLKMPSDAAFKLWIKETERLK